MTKDYLQGDESGYGSHIPILEFIFSHIQVNFALELGMGMFSTPFLIDHVTDELTSIEQQDQKWYKKVVNHIEAGEKKCEWKHDYEPRILFSLLRESYDFVLVDGSSITRAPAAAHYMQLKVDTIVVHDSESPWYAYHLLEEYSNYNGYFCWEFRDNAPWTRVYTRNQKLIDAIKSTYGV